MPGVIGKIGTALGNLGVNIATFALGRRTAGARRGSAGAGAARWNRGWRRWCSTIRAIPSITEAKLVRLAEAAKPHVRTPLNLSRIFIMLETARMRLLPWQPDDWPLLRPLATDPEVVRYISNGEPWPDERIREWAARQVAHLR